MPTFFELYEFTTFINETHMPPAHGFNFASWKDVYVWAFKHGLKARTVHNNPEASHNILHQLMKWQCKQIDAKRIND